jgi:hypothetical protein
MPDPRMFHGLPFIRFVHIIAVDELSLVHESLCRLPRLINTLMAVPAYERLELDGVRPRVLPALSASTHSISFPSNSSTGLAIQGSRFSRASPAPTTTGGICRYRTGLYGMPYLFSIDLPELCAAFADDLRPLLKVPLVQLLQGSRAMATIRVTVHQAPPATGNPPIMPPPKSIEVAHSSFAH